MARFKLHHIKSAAFSNGNKNLSCYIEERKELLHISCKLLPVVMLKATCVVLALFLLAIQVPQVSSAKKAKNGIKVKTVRLNSKKNLGRVLSIVSAVDLTLRFTHGRIGVIESSVKHLKRGRMSHTPVSLPRGQIKDLLAQTENTHFFPLGEEQ